MGQAIFERSTNLFSGNHNLHKIPVHDTGTHINITVAGKPDARADRWDGATGIRAATAQEMADYDAAAADTEATREIDDMKAVKALATETLIEINRIATAAGLSTVPGPVWRQRLIDRYKTL